MKRTAAPKCSPHLHFVTARTNRRLKLFRHPTLSQEFLNTLQELRQEHGFSLYAYVLMPDHIHLLVQPSNGQIPELMKKIKSLAARKIVARLKAENRQRVIWFSEAHFLWDFQVTAEWNSVICVCETKTAWKRCFAPAG